MIYLGQRIEAGDCLTFPHVEPYFEIKRVIENYVRGCWADKPEYELEIPLRIIIVYGVKVISEPNNILRKLINE